MLSFIKQYFTSGIAALTAMGLAYLITWVVFGRKLSNRKIQLSKRAGWPQIKDEIITTLLSFFASTAFTIVLLYCRDNGLTRFYVAEKIGWYEVLTIIIVIILSDAWFYWCHRAMHHPRLYKYVHALHHKSLDVNPFTSTSFHVVETLVLTAWVLPLAMVMPLSMAALGIIQVIGNVNNLKSHLGYELFPAFFSKVPPFTMLVTATNHSLHHTQYNGNYGLFFRFWDRICGTELDATIRTFNDIHQRSNEKVIDNTIYKSLTISNIIRETSNTVSVYFQPTDPGFYTYKAGQYLSLRIGIDGKQYHRCFSLSSSPGLDHFLRITVKLKGAASHYFHYQAKPGDTIASLLPVGDFTLTARPEASTQYVMVAGGSGITPLYSMIRQILHFEPKSKVSLLYANRSEQQIIFKKELDELAALHAHFSYIDFISGKQRIGATDLITSSNTCYYICGPESMQKEIASHLKQAGINKTAVHVEHFADGYTPWFGIGSWWKNTNLRRQL